VKKGSRDASPAQQRGAVNPKRGLEVVREATQPGFDYVDHQKRGSWVTGWKGGGKGVGVGLKGEIETLKEQSQQVRAFAEELHRWRREGRARRERQSVVLGPMRVGFKGSEKQKGSKRDRGSGVVGMLLYEGTRTFVTGEKREKFHRIRPDKDVVV